MEHYNTIIIGGGLSGCTLGYLLRKQEKKVLIIEKQKLTLKNKLCGGLLTNKSLELLKKIYKDNNLEELNIKSYDKAKITNNNITFDVDNINTYSTYRKKLDDYVLNKYKSLDGEIVDKTTYDYIDFDNNIVYFEDRQISFDSIVGADGVFSQLRKDVMNKNQRMNFALEVACESSNFNEVNISFFDNFKGYGWIIPNENYAMVGIGNVDEKNKIDNDFNSYLKGINIRPTNKKGAFLPTGNDILLNYKNNIFFVGDSAGLISPITGEGIYYSLYSALILSNTMNKNYSKNMNFIIKNIKRDLFFMKFVYNNKIRNYLFSKYKKNKNITKRINKFAKHIL
ncbi:MAG: NAD(P)/FAD-dependent oxidoreductase [Bacilli bacterium]|nr:NAD(P)/FAD-dependent oxidoreductase [Bacilli bacterium]